MPDLRISELPLKNSVSDYDVFTLLDSSTDYDNKKVNASAIKEFIVSGGAQSVVTTATSPLTITPNTCYKMGTLSELTISNYVDSPSEIEIQFATSDSFAFTASEFESHWTGKAPVFETGKRYVIALKNGVASYGELA